MKFEKVENKDKSHVDETVTSVLEDLIEKVVDSIENTDLVRQINETNVEFKEINLNSDLKKKDQNSGVSSSKTESNLFGVKWISFNNRKVPIILQNENGPCPLISICNVLLLRDQMRLADNVEIVSNEILIQNLADLLFNEFVPRLQNNSSNAVINFEQIISDSLSIFGKLQYGLDVNVKFTGVNDFEYTKEMDIFDIFSIKLFHGWLVDPEQTEYYKYLADKSYNQLVEISISGNDNTSSEITSIKLLAQDFLNSTASQLTYYGLSVLHSVLKPDELSILFRNNHFSTLYKNPKNDRLYTLVTDSGYFDHSEIVWETLDNIEGAGNYCNSNFEFSKQVSSVSDAPNQDIHDNDYLLALSLQQQEEAAQQQETRRSPPQEPVRTTRDRQSPKKKTCLLM